MQMRFAHAVLVVSLATPGFLALAQNQEPDRDVYGACMMTSEERDAFHEKMRAAPTAEERERLRVEHYALMQGRMKERGMGQGAGAGSGMGPGYGMGYGHGHGMGPGHGSADMGCGR
jgi:hypothetical protein